MKRVIDKINQIGVENVRFFVPMSPLNRCFGIAYKSSSDNIYLTECYIDEHRYKVADGYKIELRAVNEAFGSETFYQSDLDSLIKSEYLYIKEHGEYVELFVAEEPLTTNVNIRWFGTRIVNQSIQ